MMWAAVSVCLSSSVCRWARALSALKKGEEALEVGRFHEKRSIASLAQVRSWGSMTRGYLRGNLRCWVACVAVDGELGVDWALVVKPCCLTRAATTAR